ncbi:MAG: hypothetical protein J5633_04720 [Oscillospiraceae bacterium]|nr:hypothetical protein [Oscillospiraceae bacterium]
MTYAELDQHRELQLELSKAQERLRRLYEKAWPGAQNLDGMPHAPGVTDKVGKLGIEIGDYETSVEELREEVQASAEQVAAFIRTVDDRDLRLIFRLRFLRAYTWKEVADHCGEYTSDATVKGLVYDFFRNASQR